jgi:hypothetical protein
MNFTGLFSGMSHDDDRAALLFLSWADKHPYLFTLIEITGPSFYIIIAIAGFNMINWILRRPRR